MSEKTIICMAADTLAPALAILKQRGYTVRRAADERGWVQAENDQCRLTAEDTVQLLGLTAIFDARGKNWPPTAAEVNAIIELDCGDIQ